MKIRDQVDRERKFPGRDRKQPCPRNGRRARGRRSQPWDHGRWKQCSPAPGGCTAYDVVTILSKARQDITDCVVEIDAERAVEDPKVFTRIHFHFVVTGRKVDAKHVERAIHLSAEKYCSASIMLAKTAQITHDFEIREADVEKSGAKSQPGAEKLRPSNLQRPDSHQFGGVSHLALGVDAADQLDPARVPVMIRDATRIAPRTGAGSSAPPCRRAATAWPALVCLHLRRMARLVRSALRQPLEMHLEMLLHLPLRLGQETQAPAVAEQPGRRRRERRSRYRRGDRAGSCARPAQLSRRSVQARCSVSSRAASRK